MDRSRVSIPNLLSAAAVLAGLIFVGYEIRQNTKVARQEAYITFTENMNATAFSIANDGELAALLGRVMEGAEPADFTAAQRLRIELSFISLLRVWEGLYRSCQEGIADDSYFRNLSSGMHPFHTPYFRALWPTLRETVTVEFAEFFEGQTEGLGVGRQF